MHKKLKMTWNGEARIAEQDPSGAGWQRPDRSLCNRTHELKE